MCTVVGTETVPHFKFLRCEGMSSQTSKMGQKARLNRMKPTFCTTKTLVGRKSRTLIRLFRPCVVVGGLKKPHGKTQNGHLPILTRLGCRRPWGRLLAAPPPEVDMAWRCCGNLQVAVTIFLRRSGRKQDGSDGCARYL